MMTFTARADPNLTFEKTLQKNARRSITILKQKREKQKQKRKRIINNILPYSIESLPFSICDYIIAYCLRYCNIIFQKILKINKYLHRFIQF